MIPAGLPILTYQPRWTVARAVVGWSKLVERIPAVPRSIVDMGAYEGDIAFLIQYAATRSISLCAPHVRCEEARAINRQIGAFKYPEFEWVDVDYETADLVQLPDADLVICCGLIYHFSTIERCLAVIRRACSRACGGLIIESEVVDSVDEFHFGAAHPTRHDFGTTNTPEVVPPVGVVESIMGEAGLMFERVESDELADGEGHQTYAWTVKNEGHYERRQRRFWVAWRP